MPGQGNKNQPLRDRNDQGQGGRRRGGRQGNRQIGAGPVGECICNNCHYTVPHQRGMPCNQMVCPNCGSPMTRKL